MKKRLLEFFVALIFFPLVTVNMHAQSVNPLQPIDFEPGTTTYEWLFWGDKGDAAPFMVVDNPDATGSNTSAKVGRFVCHAGSNAWAGMNILDSVAIIITPANRYFAMDVYKPDISKTVISLQNGTSVNEFDAYPYNTKTNGWETLVFDMTPAIGDTFYKFVIQPDLVSSDPRTDSSVVYLDNIKWYPYDPSGGTQALQPISFENGTFSYYWLCWGDKGDAKPFSIVNNPDKSGVNTSEKVGRYICHAGSNAWAGLNITDPVGVIITDTNKFFTMDVYKPDISKTVISLQNGIPVNEFDSYPYNSKTNEWETLVFDMSSAVGDTFYKFVIQPDLVVSDPRNDSAVVYFDNIRWWSSDPSIVDTLKEYITFETGNKLWNWDTWGNKNDPSPFKIVNNPSKAGINTSENAGRFICHAGSNAWAGMNIHNAVAMTITEANKYMFMDVYKPDISKTVISLQNGTTVAEFDSYPYNSVTNQWETLTFDLSAAVGQTYFKFVIQPDLVASDPRTDSAVVYIDNIRWAPITAVPVRSATSVRVYPNPANSFLHVEGFPEKAVIQIYDPAGRILRSINSCTSSVTIDITDLKSGLYFISTGAEVISFVRQ
jgi:hypothetical protein